MKCYCKFTANNESDGESDVNVDTFEEEGLFDVLDDKVNIVKYIIYIPFFNFILCY